MSNKLDSDQTTSNSALDLDPNCLHPHSPNSVKMVHTRFVFSHFMSKTKNAWMLCIQIWYQLTRHLIISKMFEMFFCIMGWYWFTDTLLRIKVHRTMIKLSSKLYHRIEKFYIIFSFRKVLCSVFIRLFRLWYWFSKNV